MKRHLKESLIRSKSTWLYRLEMDRRWIVDVKKGIRLIKELTQNLKNVETEVGGRIQGIGCA